MKERAYFHWPGSLEPVRPYGGQPRKREMQLPQPGSARFVWLFEGQSWKKGHIIPNLVLSCIV